MKGQTNGAGQPFVQAFVQQQQLRFTTCTDLVRRSAPLLGRIHANHTAVWGVTEPHQGLRLRACLHLLTRLTTLHCLWRARC